MSRLYLDGDEELILTLYRGPTLRETVRNIRQVLNMSTTDEEMTALLRRTLEDLIMMSEEDFAARRPAGPGDPAGLMDLFYETEEAG